MIVGDIVVKTPAAIVKFLSTPGVFDRPKPGAVSKPPTPLVIDHLKTYFSEHSPE
jgi:hypothetical protein